MWCRLRHATTAPTRAGAAMQAIAIRKAGDVGAEARAPATTYAAVFGIEPSAVATRKGTQPMRETAAQ
jgi:hypothetical protein